MSPEMAVSGGDGRPPGSSGKGRLNAPSQFGIKKDIPIPHIGHLVTGERQAVNLMRIKVDSQGYICYRELVRREFELTSPLLVYNEGKILPMLTDKRGQSGKHE